MSADFTTEDLRVIASVLDQMSETTRQSGVMLHGYDDAYITYRDHVMRVRWRGGDDDGGRYLLEVPDKD